MIENINIDLILERTLIAFECKNQEQLADIFRISPSDLSARKNRGTLTKLIEKEAYRRNLSYDWIKTGQGSMTVGHSNGTPTGINESQAPYNGDHPAINTPPHIQNPFSTLPQMSSAQIPFTDRPSRATSKPFTTRLKRENNWQ